METCSELRDSKDWAFSTIHGAIGADVHFRLEVNLKWLLTKGTAVNVDEAATF